MSEYSRVHQIYQSLAQKPHDLLDNDRFFVREGYLYVWQDKKNKMKKRYAFLFNDILLLTKKENGKKFWMRNYVSLRSSKCNIADMPNTFQFNLECKSRCFIFQTTDAQLKNAWLEDLKGSISGLHDEKQRRINRDRDELLQPKKKYNQITIDEKNVESLNQTNQEIEKETKQEDIPSINENPVPKRKKSKKLSKSNKIEQLSIIDNQTNYNLFEAPNPFLENTNNTTITQINRNNFSNPFSGLNNTNYMNYTNNGLNGNNTTNNMNGFNNNTNNMNYTNNGLNGHNNNTNNMNYSNNTNIMNYSNNGLNGHNTTNDINQYNPFLNQNSVPSKSNPF